MKTFKEFMNQGVEDNDPYWGLFEINKVANRAVLSAVEYGYTKAQGEADIEIANLKKMVFDLQNATIEMAEYQKNLEQRAEYVLDKIIIEDEHNFTLEKLHRMAEDVVYDKIQNNLIDEGPFQVVLVKMIRVAYPADYGMKYEYLVVRSHV